MSKEKQIEETIDEMASSMCRYHDLHSNGKSCLTCWRRTANCDTYPILFHLAELNYRKQEWISVMEELPKMYTDVLYFDGQSIGIDFMCSDGTWCDEEVRSNKVTHWMPLPEAPKMKGGAE